MTDLTAAVLTLVLLFVALGSYHRREALQPNRAGAAIYLAGAVAWGLALMLLWVTWASSGQPAVCPEATCDSLAGSLDGADLPAEFLVGQESINEALAD